MGPEVTVVPTRATSLVLPGVEGTGVVSRDPKVPFVQTFGAGTKVKK